ARREKGSAANSLPLARAIRKAASLPRPTPPLPHRSTDTAPGCERENRAAHTTATTTAFQAHESPHTGAETVKSNRAKGHQSPDKAFLPVGPTASSSNSESAPR